MYTYSVFLYYDRPITHYYYKRLLPINNYITCQRQTYASPEKHCGIIYSGVDNGNKLCSGGNLIVRIREEGEFFLPDQRASSLQWRRNSFYLGRLISINCPTYKMFCERFDFFNLSSNFSQNLPNFYI